MRTVPVVDADAADGDDVWYAHVTTMARQRWLLLMHEPTLFPVVVPRVRAADLRQFGQLVCGAIAVGDAALRAGAFGRLDPGDVVVTPTADRSMLGFINQAFAEIEHIAWRHGGPDQVDVADLQRFLLNTPRRPGGKHAVWPISLTRQHAAARLGVVDIDSLADGPAAVLSNFAANPFAFRGREMASMEGLLQSLKCPDVAEQLVIQQLLRVQAKRAGDAHDWQATQTLWWEGEPIDRHADAYQRFLDEVYDALAAQNAQWRAALLATGDTPLVHTVGSDDPRRTVLTEREFCSRLEAIRARLR